MIVMSVHFLIPPEIDDDTSLYHLFFKKAVIFHLFAEPLILFGIIAIAGGFFGLAFSEGAVKQFNSVADGELVCHFRLAA